MKTQNTAAIGQHAETMTKEQMEARISVLSDEIDANEEENRMMQSEIDELYKRIAAIEIAQVIPGTDVQSFQTK